MKKIQGSKSVLGFLAGILLLVLMGSYQAQAAWTKSEKSRVKTLEARIQTLEKQLASQEVVTLRYLATSGAGGTYGDICPGSENLEGGQNNAYIGRLSPKKDIFGKVVTDIYGEADEPYVYTCKVSFIAKKN